LIYNKFLLLFFKQFVEGVVLLIPRKIFKVLLTELSTGFVDSYS